MIPRSLHVGTFWWVQLMARSRGWVRATSSVYRLQRSDEKNAIPFEKFRQSLLHLRLSTKSAFQSVCTHYKLWSIQRSQNSGYADEIKAKTPDPQSAYNDRSRSE
jgi:hypothetical protein